MSLKDLAIRHSYRTGRDDLLGDFYIPALGSATRYDRAVGFFSSSIFSYAAQGVSAFFGPNKGQMRLVFGGELSPDDYEAALKGEQQKALNDLLTEMVNAAIDRMLLDINRRRLELFSLLIAFGRLEIKFAMRPHGMFHEKFGVLYDAESNSVGFDGSANESGQAFLLYGNCERIRTYCSWVEGHKETIDELVTDFDALWRGVDSTCITLTLPEVSRNRLLRISEGGVVNRLTPDEESALAESSGLQVRDDKKIPLAPHVPALIDGQRLEMRVHQIEALNRWKASDYKGIAALCTGAGKTIMAAYAMARIYEANERLFCVVAVPYIALAEQWSDVLGQFGIVPIRCWSAHNWDESLSETITQFCAGVRDFGCAVVVNASLAGEFIQRQLERLESEAFLFVGDECHHHRQFAAAKVLPQSAGKRLGLSATPLHYRDEVGNSELTSYYGAVVAEYDLRQALIDQVLTPYDYHPIVVELTDVERQLYREISLRIAQLFAAGIDDENDGRLGNLLRRRAEVVAVAENKELELQRLLDAHRPEPLTLVYCGVDSESGEDGRQIDRITKLLADRAWNVARYTARERPVERRLTLQSFKAGIVDALVAMHCLDEGVDIPGCRTAYILASAADPRQFIQRRGRLLRRAPGKDKARIFDFVVVPGEVEAWTDADRRLVARELARAKEFADLAANRAAALTEVVGIATKYDLAHII